MWTESIRVVDKSSEIYGVSMFDVYWQAIIKTYTMYNVIVINIDIMLLVQCTIIV